MRIFSTDDAPADDRFDYWRAALAERFTPLRPERIGDDGFFGTIRTLDAGDASCSEVRAGRQRVHRTSPEIARSRQDILFLNVHVGGRGSFRQSGDETALAPGDIYVIDASRPFELGCAEPIAQMSIKLPRGQFPGGSQGAEETAGALIPGAAHVGRLIAASVATLWRAGDDLDTDNRSTAVRQVAELAAFEIGRRSRPLPAPRRALHAGLFARAATLILARATDPDLTPAAVATDIGVPLRSLQAIFARNDSSIARRIQEERLAAATRLLADPAERGRAVGEIAFSCGFNDLSHFTRCFAAAHGAPPGAWRRHRLS